LEHYKLKDTELQVLQINQRDILSARKYSDRTDELLLRYENLLDAKEAEVKKLETELAKTRKIATIPLEIVPELKALFPEITSFSLNRHLVVRTDSLAADTVFMAFVSYRPKGKQPDK
jgi:hypothetical protein